MLHKVIYSILLVIGVTSLATSQEGKKVFETYCWGCHHQTAVAFGPSFAQIASQRNGDDIRAMITDPESVSKIFGYKRNAMPPFKLTEDELNSITSYILSFKTEQNQNNENDRKEKP